MAVAALVLMGCRGTSYPKLNQPGISNVTYVGAFSDYGRVYRVTYAVLNQYSLIKYAHYSRGSIVAELLTNREYLDKTRTMIYASVRKQGKSLFDPRYYDVEVRVVKQIDTSDANYFSNEVAPYRWRTVNFDQQLETKLLNEIKLAMTQDGYLKKKNILESGEGKGSAPAAAPKKKRVPLKSAAKKKETPIKENYVSHGTPKSEESNFNSYVLLGTAYTNKDRWEMAVVYFRSALAYMPNKQSGYYYLTTGYMGDQKYDMALETLGKGLGLNDTPDPVYLLELFASEDQFESLHKSLSGSPEKDVLRAFLCLGMGRNKEARQILSTVQKEELAPLVKKLDILAQKKNPSYRKMY